jgi:hypothetical protein
MKPCLKLAMLQSLADHLPVEPRAVISHITLFDVLMVCSRSERGTLVLDWNNLYHVGTLHLLHDHLPPDTYRWVRGHLRFDGVPPAVVASLNL